MESELIAAKKRLDELLKERAEIELQIAEAEKAKERLQEMLNGRNRLGEIALAELAVRDAAFPVYYKSVYHTERIVGVDKKWIMIRRDGSDNIVRYKRENGWRERLRYGYDKINVQEALEIWEKRKAEN